MRTLKRLTETSKLTGDEAGESPVDPPTDDDHRQHVGDISFEHVTHRIWICHGIGRRSLFPFRFEVALLLVVEEVSSCQESLSRDVFAIFAQ